MALRLALFVSSDVIEAGFKAVIGTRLTEVDCPPGSHTQKPTGNIEGSPSVRLIRT